MILHIFTMYEASDGKTRQRNEIAQQTWKLQPWVETPVLDKDLPSMWEENGRTFPYICDVFNIGVSCTKNDKDILVYTNADIHVCSDLCVQLNKIFEQTDACYAYRRDFSKLSSPIPDAKFETGSDYVGSDLAACTVGWWKQYGKELSGMILGAEAWDPMFRQLADETNPNRITVLNNVICHERHASYWEQPQNRYALKMQRQAVTLAWKFFASRGIDPAVRYISLEHFMPDIPVNNNITCDLVVLGLGLDGNEITSALNNLEVNLLGLDWKCFLCAPPNVLPVIHSKLLKNVFTVNESTIPKLRPNRYARTARLRNPVHNRYARMACLRNQVLRVYRNSGVQAKAILWMDMDCYGFWESHESIASLLTRNDWDVVATYGLRVATNYHDVHTAKVKINEKEWTYYDWLAYEDTANRRVLWHSKPSTQVYSHGKVPPETQFVNGVDGIPDVKGTQVNSAFGPVCFYRPESIHELWYDEHAEQCEHQGFHAAMRQQGHNRIFISDDIITLYDSP